MVCQRWRSAATFAVLIAAVPFVAACEPGRPAGPGTTSAQASSQGEPPISVEVNQSRDQYGKQAILIQLTNTTEWSLVVSGAQVHTGLFQGDIAWKANDGALELPPKQPKSLPANLPAAACTQASSGPATATVQYLDITKEHRETTTEASDPFNVLPRNSDELCLSADAAAIASIVLDPQLEVAPDGKTAVVHLLITPASTSSPSILTIESIDETTLLAEPPTDPWPRNIVGTAGAGVRVVPLRIRPARCDPHAVAEDKVGTLLPLRVTAGERSGLLKIAAPTELKGRIYDFVTAACGEG